MVSLSGRFCPEPPGAVPWLVQNHSTICLSGGKYRPNIWACQRGKQKIFKNFYCLFLSVSGMPQRGNPLFYWVFWVFHPPPSPSQIFFARQAPAPRPSHTRAEPPANGRADGGRRIRFANENVRRIDYGYGECLSHGWQYTKSRMACIGGVVKMLPMWKCCQFQCCQWSMGRARRPAGICGHGSPPPR